MIVLILSISICLTLLFEIWLFMVLKTRNSFSRVIRVPNLNNLAINQKYYHIEEFEEALKNEPWIFEKNAELKSLLAMQWTMNLVKKYYPNPIETRDSSRLLKSARSGSAIICTGMAILFRQILHCVDIKSRSILLKTNLFNTYDNHETVEVLLNDKWVIMDPTFNITVIDPDHNLLSAMEIKQFLINGHSNDITLKFHGEVSYPVRTEDYYIGYLSFFNNVFVIKRSKIKLLNLPLLSYIFGNKLYYEKLPQESNSHLKFWERIYLMSSLILPVLIINLIILLFIYLILKE